MHIGVRRGSWAALVWTIGAISVGIPGVAGEQPTVGAASVLEVGPTCSCETLLEITIQTVERSYVAYRMEILGTPREPDYDARTTSAREGAREPGVDCLNLIGNWITGFGDGHLFLLENPSFTPEQLDSLSKTGIRTQWTPEAIARELDGRSDLDPIEGYWYSSGARYGILRDRTNPSEYIAVVLETNAEGWEPGDLKARFRSESAGHYAATYAVGDRSTRRYRASLHRGGLLVMPAIGWARMSGPTGPAEPGFDPVDPLAPTVRNLGEGALVISVPSHAPQYRERLQEIVNREHERLLAAPLLIVDLRGDGGGGSLTTAPLMPYIHATPERDVPGPEGDPVVLSSPETIRYFSGWKSADGDDPEWLTDLLGRLGQNLGAIVPFMDPPSTSRGWVPEQVYEGPAAVALLVDGGVGSAAEAFVLFALHSPRVTVYGQPTYGMIDYQNVGITAIACPGAGLLLGFPTIAATATLPRDGLNATGILPHVIIDLGREDPFARILADQGIR